MKKRRKNFLKKNKKGLSAVVITLIIILISLAAIGVVWFVVRNLLVTGSKQVGIGQFTISLSITKAYEQTGNITVNVKRNVGAGELSKIKFILSDGKNSEVITQSAALTELEEKNFFIHPNTLIATQVQTVSVAPVSSTADGEIKGDITSTYNLISGTSTGGNGTNGGNTQCTPSCVGNGIQYQCGDNGCGNSCGTCPGDKPTCNNHVCVPASGCQEESKQTTCGNWVCGIKTNNCGNNVNCDAGVCQGKLCDGLGHCLNIVPINSGKVGDTWVSGMYFSSPNLPKDMTGLVGDYIDFSGGSSETKCMMIARWVLSTDTPGYPYSHIGFSFTTNIKTGDSYNIWDTSEKCQANLTSPLP